MSPASPRRRHDDDAGLRACRSVRGRRQRHHEPHDDSASACHPARPVPMLMINGNRRSADPLCRRERQQPLCGGRILVRGKDAGVLAPRQRLRGAGRSLDQSRRPRSQRSEHGDADRVALPAGRDTLLYRVNGGGHRMPAPLPTRALRASPRRFFGPQNHDIDGAETIWAFFSKFP